MNLKTALLESAHFIDVRAPVEFNQGHIPGAVNLPILNDEERAQVGTVYKEKGSEAAVALGHQLISGSIKESRVEAWKAFVQKHPNSLIYCFRGGQRSQISQRWLSEAGLSLFRVSGGYKKSRQIFLSELQNFSLEQKVVLISGPTGSGKTQILNELALVKPVLNLENLVHHRGSAFGGRRRAQPTQAQFENELAVKIIQLRAAVDKPVFLEDESRMIGQLTVPGNLFEKMRSSEVVWIDEPLQVRVESIFQDYVVQSEYERPDELNTQFEKSLHSISKKLGGLKTQEILQDMRAAIRDPNLHKIWIEKLLKIYYDPFYLRSLEKRNVKVVFKGSRQECLQFLSR